MNDTDEQRQAMLAWKRAYGFRWRKHLIDAWANATYPGVDERHAATLQGLRNSGEFGPRRLLRYTPEKRDGNDD